MIDNKKSNELKLKLKAKPFAKKYTETSIFNILCTFLKYFREHCLTDMTKDDRLIYGRQCSQKINEAILVFRRAFDNSDVVLKANYLTELEDILKEIEAEIFIVSQIQALHLSKVAVCIRNLGSVQTSVSKFKNSLNKKNDNAYDCKGKPRKMGY